MSFPLRDAQFWVVTAIAGAFVLYLVRGFLPFPWLRRRLDRAKRERKATLTVRGRPVDKA